MPQITAAAAIQICLLLSALPAQYLISQWTGNSAAQRNRATQRLLGTWNNFRKSYLNVGEWTDWLNRWIANLVPISDLGQQDQDGESPALEVLLYSNDQGYFGASTEVRSPRPAGVLFHVGEVVMDMDNHMVGVIVSWDEQLRAPPEWVKKMYTGTELQKAEQIPHYKVLFNGPGPSSVFVGYIPQTSLERFIGIKPDIPTLDHYFSHFDGERFIMKSWLRDIFPHD
ncbi:uncharacterized protein [Lepisosteus oculatus]|uniref:uncharacterized protein isoform X2 n=1 Tax=Lepisosteus oculatus TaxID=7918 RepID=UPI00073FED27|nr:PREDICTED: uncharacterized protein LOC107077341 isoform X2 [Lepisosteus oculatus]